MDRFALTSSTSRAFLRSQVSALLTVPPSHMRLLTGRALSPEGWEERPAPGPGLLLSLARLRPPRQGVRSRSWLAPTAGSTHVIGCLLYTSDAADDLLCV